MIITNPVSMLATPALTLVTDAPKLANGLCCFLPIGSGIHDA
jgi:hypothetical protein